MQTWDKIAAQGGILVPAHLELQSYAVVLRFLQEACDTVSKRLQIISGHLAGREEEYPRSPASV